MLPVIAVRLIRGMIMMTGCSYGNDLSGESIHQERKEDHISSSSKVAPVRFFDTLLINHYEGASTIRKVLAGEIDQRLFKQSGILYIIY